MNQEQNSESKDIVADFLKGIVFALLGLAVVISIYAIVQAKRELRDAEREADAAHAARVIMEGGQSSCK